MSGTSAVQGPVRGMAVPRIRPLTTREFRRFQSLIHEQAGIFLGPSKKALLTRRLTHRLVDLGLTSFGAYYERVVGERGKPELTTMLDCICTNETRFFREPRQFELLEQHLLPGWRDAGNDGRRRRRIKAWSAACSTGEEPFSIAMALLRCFSRSAGWDLGVLASDLSTRVLGQARAATWPVEKAKEVPEPYRKAFMLKGVRSRAGTMRAGPEIEALVRFQRVNLNDSHYAVDGPFDLIFCRNVLIYFEPQDRVRVVERLLRHLAPGGCLFVGVAESLRFADLGLSCLAPGAYTPASNGSPGREIRSEEHA